MQPETKAGEIWVAKNKGFFVAFKVTRNLPARICALLCICAIKTEAAQER